MDTLDPCPNAAAPPAASLASDLLSGARPRAIVPRSMEETLRLARAVMAARMAPPGIDTPEACMIAIMHGLELGLTPLAALQRIAVINGRPAIWGDGALALVRASGLCAGVKEWLEGDGETCWTAVCQVKRKGERSWLVRSFDTGDAIRALVWGKPGPWSEYPKRMLQMRARAFALRDGFPDVLGGLYLREEVEGGGFATRAPSPERLFGGPGTGASRGGGPAAAPQNAGGAAVLAVAPAPAPTLDVGVGAPRRDAAGGDATAWSGRPVLADYDDALCCGFDQATLDEIREEFAPRLAGLGGEEARRAEAAWARHCGRVAGLAAAPAVAAALGAAS